MNNYLTGYQSSKYANALSEFGEVIECPAGGWLQKSYPGSNIANALKKDYCGDLDYDLKSLYPLFTPRDFNSNTFLGEMWEQLYHPGLVSLTLVTDPLAYISEHLAMQFDYIKKYKTHYIVDLHKPLHMAHDHWDRIRSFAKTNYEVKLRVLNPTVNTVDYAKHFYFLYKQLIEKHKITGIARFSENSFIKQLNVPGLLVMDVSKDNKLPEVVRSFYLQTERVTGDKIAYFHLGASSPKGYYINGSYAIHYQMIMFLKQIGVDKLVLGGTTDGANAEGLETFKAGFANETRTNYILGKIFNKKAYESLSKGFNGNYFPRYSNPIGSLNDLFKV